MRIGIPHGSFQESCGSEILAAFDKAVAQMVALGAQIQEIPSVTLRELWAVIWPIMLSEAASYHLGNMKERSAEYNRDLRLLLAMGALIPARTYLHAQRVRRQIRDQVLRWLETVDVIMMPNAGFVPGPIASEELFGVPPVGWDFPLYTALFNLTGTPAISLPCGFSSEGLPLGVQLAGKPFDEATVLQAAYAYEQATSWRLRHPAL